MENMSGIDIEYRPWGFFKNHESVEGAHLKTLHVQSGTRLSLQRHAKRDETWILISGDAQAETGTCPEELVSASLVRYEPFYIPRHIIHRLSSQQGAVIVEISAGTFEESDIERFADDYGRLEPHTKK